jgi:hypothetical protein
MPKKKENLEKKVKKLEHQVSHFKRQANKFEKAMLTQDNFVDRTKEIISVLTPPSSYKPRKYKKPHTEQDLVLMFSDCQIGEKIEYKETKLDSYNMRIFGQRLERLYHSLLSITGRHRSDTPINRLNIFMLGDIVEGEQVFRGQGTRLEDNVMKQFFEGMYQVSNFLRGVSGEFQNVDVHCIAGNHGRINKKDESKFYVNWDFLMYKYIAEALKDCKNVKFEIPWSWWDIKKVKGWKFYLTHGDDLRRYMGIPWYSLEKMDGRVKDIMQSIGKKYDYMCIGHHHTAFDWDSAAGERICNGSFSSGNYYAAKKLWLSCRPTQVLFGVHPDIGITFKYKIRMDQGHRKKLLTENGTT